MSEKITQEQEGAAEKGEGKIPVDTPESTPETVKTTSDSTTVSAEATTSTKKSESEEALSETGKENAKRALENEEATSNSTKEKADSQTTADEPKSDEALSEIDEENAEDAEDDDNKQRHTIPIKEYSEMSMENLVGELQLLVRTEKIQAIKRHVDGIKQEFDLKFEEFLDGKKAEFIESGGNEIDFRYNSVTKRQFKDVYGEYREKRNQYYKARENNLKQNLNSRLAIIEELKGLVSVDEDMSTTYNSFKSLQQQWRETGPIPRNQYNDVWRTYQHHVEKFYDFLHLNRELRDLDFKHNLEEKNKLAARAESLAEEKDLGSAFRELQELHRIWKEEIGPVAREEREAIWDRFSAATKILHQRRQEHQKELDKLYEENLVFKNELIDKLKDLTENTAENHRGLQQQIKQVSDIREKFFKAGRVPQKSNEATWKAFKTATRNFNRSKNTFYKSLKKDQQENLEKKRELVTIAKSLKYSEDWNTATSEFKRIQSDWKKIGHVPRKNSDTIWKEFKNACNHYFDRLHAQKNSSQKEEEENLQNKKAKIEELKAWAPSNDQDKDLIHLKAAIKEWKGLGRVPFKQKHIDQKFNKVLEEKFKKIGLSKKDSELLQYGTKIQQLANADDQDRALGNERQFIRKKIGESKNEILQLENNLQFFKHADEDNPLVKEVIQNIQRHKNDLETWKGKLKKLNVLEHHLNKEEEEDTPEASSEEE